MEIDELMREFAVASGIDDVRSDGEGAYHFDIDGMSVSFAAVPETGDMITWADVAEPPPEGRERIYHSLLEAMFMGEGSGGATFSVARDTGRICLHRIDPLATLDFDRFRAMLERFVNVLETWRKLIADFREVAPDLDRASESEARSGLGLDGCMRV